jgi:primosomal protein N' (replication factor Y)
MTAPLFDGLAPLGPDDAADERILRVALPVPLDQLFDYRLPARLVAAHADVRPGTRVRVPFAGQLLVGLVVPKDLMTVDSVDREDRMDQSDRDEPRPPLADIQTIFDEEPVVSESMVRMLAEAAREIFAPIGLAVAHALPPGSSPRTARPYALTPRGDRTLAHGTRASDALGKDTGRILSRIARKPLTLAALSRAFPDIRVEKCLDGLLQDGLIERRLEMRSAKARIPTDRIVHVAAGIDPERAEHKTLARAASQAALFAKIARAEDGLATRSLTASDLGAGALVRALEKRGLVVFEERPRLFATETILDGGGEVSLTDDQTEVLGPICDAIKRQVPESFLLHGVTGSGKTEVYLRAIAVVLEAGRQALVLVPEITLTHQIVARVRARFGDQVAVLHSGLKPGERLAQWERLRSRQTAIAVGARSALFAPLDALGLIVIDEEHDGAYKNDEGFRYHARDLAELLARNAHCPLILGSATPSLETRHRAELDQIRRLSLPRRVGGRPLPAVEIVDLAKEKLKNPRGRKTILSKLLRNAIGQALEQGGQTILFLNRRGFSTRIFCFQCGHAERCDDCDVALVYHAADYQLRCHYCDLVRAVPETCSGCGDPETALLGVGTERLEEEVRSVFPSARTMRLDRDVASRRGHTESVLRALKDETVDIVIGTQMVAKGHDFPGVQLVGVVAADIGLHLPDFRAAERTFQLLTQVAGRAGRADRPGRVVVQTFVPDHYALAPVGSHDYEGFYREEIEHREALGYPPFAGLTRVVIHAEEESDAREAAETLAGAARSEIPDGARLELLGPAPAPLSKLRGRYRFMLLLKGQDGPLLRRVSQAILAASKQLPRAVQTALDARPVNML